jgi:hypothetical protein
MRRRVVCGYGSVEPSADNKAIATHHNGADRHLPGHLREARLFQGEVHKLLIHCRMLNYIAMKLLPTLLVLLLWAAPVGAQGVRMAADFLPLEVGNRWVYSVTDEAGQKLGELDFAVEDYQIISGASFYLLTSFPFTGEDRIRQVRYDRSERQFMRVRDKDEGPLFLSDGATTEVIQADSAGIPLKFVLNTDTMALTFERGVGIVEARFKDPGGARIARLSRREGNGLGTNTGGVTAVSPAGKTLPDLDPPVPAAGSQTRRVETITPVTETNPRLTVTAAPSARGILLVFTVENTADKLLPFRFSSGQSFDFLIREPSSGKEVWRWSRDQFFTQVIRSEAIRGSGKWTFEATWNRRDNEGQPVVPGQYHLYAILTAEPAVQASPVPITIP